MAQEYAEDTIRVSDDHGLVLYGAMARVTLGWTRIEHKQLAEAIQLMRDGLADLQSTGTEVLHAYFWALLSEALSESGESKEELRVLEDALAVIHRNGERYYEAELFRLRGELLLNQSAGRAVFRAVAGGNTVFETEPSSVAIAEYCFNESIKIAQQQNALSLELRAVTSLAHLYQTQDRCEEARAILAGILDRFTEGFATIDLRDARALLEELS
jgi:predicted ATPase